jgi:diaminohydroxyphosphoribosylaminopyrimidine deaminase/5-amino-6-(5-phosphoribosylamino)uracil reductase
VAADNPQLTVRLAHGPNPARIVLDSRLRSSPRARWLAEDGSRRVVTTTRTAPPAQRQAFAEIGAEIWLLPRNRHGGMDLTAFLDKATEAGFRSLMVEGGGKVASSFLAAGLANRIEFFYAPILLGAEGLSFTRDFHVNRMALAPRFHNVSLRRLGEDWHIRADL